MVPPNCIFELRKCLRRFRRERQGPAPGNGGLCQLFVSIVANFPGEYNPQRAEFEKSDSPGKSAVGIGVFRTIAALGYHRGTQPMASPLAITFPMAVMASSAAFAALLFPQAQRDRHRQSARTMETNFFMLDPHSLSCAAAEKRNSARRNDLTGRDTPGHYIQHTVFFREKPLTGCIGFEIFLMGWGIGNGKLVFADQF